MQENRWLKLHPKAKIALIIKPMIGITMLIFFLTISMIGLIISGDISVIAFLFILIVLIVILVFIVIAWAIMFYNRYMFRIGQDAVYINRGILWKRNVMIPYERIQHTSVTRGPIDLILGLHILNIFTAGTGSVGARFGGTASAFAAEGSIPGLADPKPFQEAIMSRVRALRGDGLGVVQPSAGKTPSAIYPQPAASPTTSMVMPQPEVQGEMLSELKKIREILEKQNQK